MEFERIEITPKEPINFAEYEYVKSDWMVLVDYTNGTACEYNSKTGEARNYPYKRATLEMFTLG